MRTIFCCAAAIAALALSACTSHSPTIRVEGWSSLRQSEGGAPPSAPIHGHIHRVEHAKHGTLQLVFDEAIGAYTVIELPGYYYHDGMYLRMQDGRWMAAKDLGGPWQQRSVASLPAGLRVQSSGAAGQLPARHP